MPVSRLRVGLLLVLVVAGAGCVRAGFLGASDSGASGASDRGGTDAMSGALDRGVAAEAPASPVAWPLPLPCAPSISWFADFSSDPTRQDLNGDQVEDWAIRDGSPFDATRLVDGIWISPTAAYQHLDTRPKRSFQGRAVGDIRMRATSAGSADCGASFWLWVGETTSSAMLISACVALEAGAQRIRVSGQDATQANALLLEHRHPSTDFFFLRLDVDDASDQVTVYLDSQRLGTYAVPPWPFQVGNEGQMFSTVTSKYGDGEYDAVRVVECN
jgi:hypothetical protein